MWSWEESEATANLVEKSQRIKKRIEHKWETVWGIRKAKKDSKTGRIKRDNVLSFFLSDHSLLSRIKTAHILAAFFCHMIFVRFFLLIITCVSVQLSLLYLCLTHILHSTERYRYLLTQNSLRIHYENRERSKLKGKRFYRVFLG